MDDYTPSRAGEIEGGEEFWRETDAALAARRREQTRRAVEEMRAREVAVTAEVLLDAVAESELFEPEERRAILSRLSGLTPAQALRAQVLRLQLAAETLCTRTLDGSGIVDRDASCRKCEALAAGREQGRACYEAEVGPLARKVRA